MPTASPRQGVTRNRSLALDDVFKANREADDADGDEGSRFGTTSTIHHLYRPHNRTRDDMSEAGNQSVSTLGARGVKKASSTARKDGRSSTGRTVVKRTSSRRVDGSQSFSATTELIELLSPTRVTKQTLDTAENADDGATSPPKKTDDTTSTTPTEERRRRIPSRAKSSDAILDHKPRGEKRGESTRRTTTSRRNFSHTGGATKVSKKEDSASDIAADIVVEPKLEMQPKRIHRRHPSQSTETLKDNEVSSHSRGAEKESSHKTSSRQSSSKSNRQNSNSRTDKERERERQPSDAARESKRSAPSRTASRSSSRPTSKTELGSSSPKRTIHSKKDSSEAKVTPRRSSESKRSSKHHHRTTESPSTNDTHGQALRKPSIQDTGSSKARRQRRLDTSSPERAKGDPEDYGYGPGSPGRSPKKSVGRVQLDDHSDGSSSIDRYEADENSCESSSGSGSGSGSSDDDDDYYANPYQSKTRKGRHHDDDEDTVLQFDPTQHDGVQEVKRAGSMQYEFENADGTSVMGQITELADPVGESQMLAAQQEHDRRKESLFDFLATEDADDDAFEAAGSDSGEDERQTRLHVSMPIGSIGGDATHLADEEGRDQRQDSWTKTGDDDPLSPTQDAVSPLKSKRSKKLARNPAPESLPEIAVSSNNQRSETRKKSGGLKKVNGEDQALSGGGRIKVPLSPSKVIAKVKMFSLSDSFNLDKDGNEDDEDEDEDDADAAADDADESPTHPDTEASAYATTSPMKEADSPKKLGRKKGKGLGGIGRYFGRSKRHDDDDDMMSVGSTSVGFFNPTKAKHQLLGGDDSSVESGLF